jgi:hypothetical protein
VFPAWFAATTTVPTPVIVSVLPLTDPGPLTTSKVTALPEAPPVAKSAIGETPYVTGEERGANVMVCVACVMLKLTETLCGAA